MTRESHFSADETSTRQRILDAAMELFSEGGYGSTPIKAIAKACGISDAGVFYHFRSKKAILLALWQKPNTVILQEVSGEAVSDSATLTRLILQNIDAAAENACLHRLLIRQQLDGDVHASAARTAFMAGWRESMRRWFVLYEPASAALMIDAFINALLGIIFLAEVEHGAALPEVAATAEFRAQAVDIVSRAVALERFPKAARVATRGAAEASL